MFWNECTRGLKWNFYPYIEIEIEEGADIYLTLLEHLHLYKRLWEKKARQLRTVADDMIHSTYS